MSAAQFLDDPISVEAKMTGRYLFPQQITWREQTFVVVSVGRQWQEDDGRHILVELHEGSRMEVKLLSDLNWRLHRYWPPTYMA